MAPSFSSVVLGEPSYDPRDSGITQWGLPYGLVGVKDRQGLLFLETPVFDFTKLNPEFTPLLKKLISNMEALGHTIKPYYGIRTLTEQARIWRRSRSTAEVRELMDTLEANNAPYALSVLKSVGPQKMGPWATNTYMYSYHLIGKACDMFIDGDEYGGDVYDVLADEAIKVGLTPGRYFSTVDSGHVQLGRKELTKTYTLAEMDVILKNLLA